MKSWMWVLVAVILIIVLAAVFMLRPTTVIAPESSISPTNTSQSGAQFIQMEPDFIAPSVSPSLSPSTSVSPAAKVPANTISITETGFLPENLTIKSGDTVVFVNNGQAQHWPASDPHPAHTNYAGFDAEKSLETGDTFNFTFTKTGVWEFHDHLNPVLRGTIIVQ